MENSYNNLWAKLVSLYPHKESINLLSNEHQVDGEWKIYQNATGDTKIVCLSSSCMKVDNEWLGMNQEMKLLGGEMIAFSEERNRIDNAFDYVFCLSKDNSESSEMIENEIKRKREEADESKFHIMSNKMTKLQNEMNEELICAICIEVISDCVTLSPCLHSFCNHCVTSFRKSSTECPTCRQKIQSVRKNPFINRLLRSIKSAFSNPETTLKQDSSLLNESKNGEDDHRYKGSWKNGKKEGKGTMFYEMTSFYEGNWKNDRREGKGTMFYDDGSVYDGSWKKDKKDGQGILRLKDGTIFKGRWSNDVMEPLGEIRFLCGSTYQGEIKDLKKHGKGVWKMHNDWMYEGDFKEDLMDGFGKCSSKNGGEFEGIWVKGLRNGYGTMKYENGGTYMGEWKDNVRDGKGVILAPNGDKYEGDWKENLLHGVGKYTWKNGEEYEGNWWKGSRNGNGTMKYNDNWKTDDGRRILIRKSGPTLEGSWINDILQPLVKIESSKGDRYEGEINSEILRNMGREFLPERIVLDMIDPGLVMTLLVLRKISRSQLEVKLEEAK